MARPRRQDDPRPDHGETSYKGSGCLAGRKALITGGDSRMGRAAAIAFAREGADVAFNYLPVEEPDAQEVVQLITEPQHLHADCRRVGDILGRVGDKWTILLLMAIGDRRMRFGELQRAIGGISQRMLTVTLRKLEHDGILIRTLAQACARPDR
jgi:NAD(P)-dependent dehydrogenase (short-subunit alcohol dehydrogenase family)